MGSERTKSNKIIIIREIGLIEARNLILNMNKLKTRFHKNRYALCSRIRFDDQVIDK